MIFHLDGSDRQSVVALYKDTGKIAWQTKRSEKCETTQASKILLLRLLPIYGQPTLISCAADWVYGYDPKGRELWKIKYGILGFSNVACPVLGHGMFFISTCFMKGEIHAYRYAGSRFQNLYGR